MSETRERLHKILARAGLGSRRQMEEWIRAGCVSINGKIATIGDSATAENVVRVDGHIIGSDRLFQKQIRIIGYHKPAGEVCTRDDPEGRRTVFESLPGLRTGRWINIGRLDMNTSGLLLFTTDGELAHKLMHPSQQIEREYAVRILGEVDEAMIARLKSGVELEDGMASFDHIVKIGETSAANQWYHVILREGRNREVRRLWEAAGVQVSRLTRVRFGNVILPRHVRMGKIWDIEPSEAKALATLAGIQHFNIDAISVYKRKAKGPSSDRTAPARSANSSHKPHRSTAKSSTGDSPWKKRRGK